MIFSQLFLRGVTFISLKVFLKLGDLRKKPLLFMPWTTFQGWCSVLQPPSIIDTNSTESAGECWKITIVYPTPKIPHQMSRLKTYKTKVLLVPLSSSYYLFVLPQQTGSMPYPLIFPLHNIRSKTSHDFYRSTNYLRVPSTNWQLQNQERIQQIMSRHSREMWTTTLR